MRTFQVAISIGASITVPDKLIESLIAEAALSPEMGGDRYLHTLYTDHVLNEPNLDEFVQKALKNALRNIARNGIVSDIGGLGEGVGVRASPAVVSVSVPVRVVTRVKSREQVETSGIPPMIGQRVPYTVPGDLGEQSEVTPD